MDEPRPYVLARLHQAILNDPRFTEQAVEIELIEDRVVLRGEVATSERREGIVALIGELMPGLAIINDLCISAVRQQPPEAEVL